MECVTNQIAIALATSGHPDLMLSAITPSLVSYAADALAELFRSGGFHLAYGYDDGLCINQTYHSQSSREQLEDVGITLLQVMQADQSTAIALAVRTTPSGAFSNSRKALVFSGAIRIAGAWFSTLQGGVGVGELISALKEQPDPKSLRMRKLHGRDVATAVQARVGGLFA